MSYQHLKVPLNEQRQLSPEHYFLILILIFGLFSAFITFPLANGDEGFHLSKSYSIFSKEHPSSMETQVIRNLESIATAPSREIDVFNQETFNSEKLTDVQQDSISFNLLKDDNSTLKIDIAHIPPALGVLIGRAIYPSYGFMLFCSRIANLIFFVTCLFFVIKYSKVGKWSLVMLFSIPFMQKIASPSYDVFSYVAVSAFTVNILALAKLHSIKKLSRQQILYTFFTILLILFSKSNYIFVLFSLLILPMFLTPAFNSYKNLEQKKKILFWGIISILSLVFILYLNQKFDLIHFAKIFFNNYLNVITMGRRGSSIFNVVSTILPDMFNIFWILSVFFIMLGEERYEWHIGFIVGEIITFFINWIGIYAGFYLIFNQPEHSFDDMSGRYLHPYLICFLPLTQYLSYRYNFKLSQRAIKTVALTSTLIIMVCYLFICYYRGYIVRTTPTWIS